MRNGAPFSKPKVRLYGETGDAQQYLGEAYNLLYKVRAYIEATGTPVFAMSRTLENGAHVTASVVGNEEIVTCTPATHVRQDVEQDQDFFRLAFYAIPTSASLPTGIAENPSHVWHSYNLRGTPPENQAFDGDNKLVSKYQLHEHPGSNTWYSRSVLDRGAPLVVSWWWSDGRYRRPGTPVAATDKIRQVANGRLWINGRPHRLFVRNQDNELVQINCASAGLRGGEDGLTLFVTRFDGPNTILYRAPIARKPTGVAQAPTDLVLEQLGAVARQFVHPLYFNESCTKMISVARGAEDAGGSGDPWTHTEVVEIDVDSLAIEALKSGAAEDVILASTTTADSVSGPQGGYTLSLEKESDGRLFEETRLLAADYRGNTPVYIHAEIRLEMDMDYRQSAHYYRAPSVSDSEIDWEYKLELLDSGQDWDEYREHAWSPVYRTLAVSTETGAASLAVKIIHSLNGQLHEFKEQICDGLSWTVNARFDHISGGIYRVWYSKTTGERIVQSPITDLPELAPREHNGFFERVYNGEAQPVLTPAWQANVQAVDGDLRSDAFVFLVGYQSYKRTYDQTRQHTTSSGGLDSNDKWQFPYSFGVFGQFLEWGAGTANTPYTGDWGLEVDEHFQYVSVLGGNTEVVSCRFRPAVEATPAFPTVTWETAISNSSDSGWRNSTVSTINTSPSLTNYVGENVPDLTAAINEVMTQNGILANALWPEIYHVAASFVPGYAYLSLHTHDLFSEAGDRLAPIKREVFMVAGNAFEIPANKYISGDKETLTEAVFLGVSEHDEATQ